MKSLFSLFLLILAFVLPACNGDRAVAQDEKLKAARAGYESLLAMFPENTQGKGLDNYLEVVDHQPMTYGLVLSAEAIRYKVKPTAEGYRRMHNALKWLTENRDLHQDWQPGWGLPQPWDAFSDGTTNGPNQPYTITTAIVLNGMLDALSVPDFGSRSERAATKELIRRVVLRWCHELWETGFGGGYFRYSPCECDSAFAVNSPSMFLGSMARFLHEQGDGLSVEDRKLIQSRCDDLARAIANTVQMRNGAPFWLYIPMPNRYNRKSPNDLVHQVYTLWGAETYRDCGGTVKFPWTRREAIESLDRFLVDGYALSLACDENPPSNQKSILWGTGSLLAFYTKWGTQKQADAAFDALIKQHGPLPSLRLNYTTPPNDKRFYARQAAHALWGMAYYCYGRNNLAH